MIAATMKIINLTMDAFRNGDLEKAHKVEPLESVIDKLKRNSKTGILKELKRANALLIRASFILI